MFEKFDLPQPPTFETVEAERQHRKQRLAAALPKIAAHAPTF
ncbi:MAG: hypothetical protein WAN66_26305 [Limnoraphis robusta]